MTSAPSSSVRVERSRDILPSEAEALPVLGVARTGFSTSLEANGAWAVLKTVPDPEIPVLSIVDLGIVREATDECVVLTPTYTGCPATQVIEAMVRSALDEVGLDHIRIETTLTPPWTTDWITEEGRAKLKAYGIAPPLPAGSRAVECPQCGSVATEEVSRFGSTPCKSLWRCGDCLEPFDHFKCH